MLGLGCSRLRFRSPGRVAVWFVPPQSILAISCQDPPPQAPKFTSLTEMLIHTEIIIQTENIIQPECMIQVLERVHDDGFVRAFLDGTLDASSPVKSILAIAYQNFPLRTPNVDFSEDILFQPLTEIMIQVLERVHDDGFVRAFLDGTLDASLPQKSILALENYVLFTAHPKRRFLNRYPVLTAN